MHRTIYSTSGSTIAGLIARANKWRGEAAYRVFNSLAKGEAAVVTDLQQPAQRPVALGFSDHDLAYWRDHFLSRVAGWESLQRDAMAFVASMNTRAAHNGGRWEGENKARRDRAYGDARRAGDKIRAAKAFAGLVETILAERHPAPAPAVEEPVMTEAALAPEPVKARVKSRAKKGPAQCRGEITLQGFEALKEYTENTAMFLAK